MQTPQGSGPTDSRTFVVTVDFGAGQVSGMDPLAESMVEFIQEDRVTADDDLAMLCVEGLAHYWRTGEFSPEQVKLLRTALTVY